MEETPGKVIISEKEARQWGVIPRRRHKPNKPLVETPTQVVVDPRTARRMGLSKEEIQEHTITQEELPV